jgi:hypothetical protein
LSLLLVMVEHPILVARLDNNLHLVVQILKLVDLVPIYYAVVVVVVVVVV